MEEAPPAKFAEVIVPLSLTLESLQAPRSLGSRFSTVFLTLSVLYSDKALHHCGNRFLCQTTESQESGCWAPPVLFFAGILPSRCRMESPAPALRWGPARKQCAVRRPLKVRYMGKDDGGSRSARPSCCLTYLEHNKRIGISMRPYI